MQETGCKTFIFILVLQFLFDNSTEYSQKNPEGILINCLGLMLVGLGLSVGYIVTTPDYARQTLPEEEHLQLKD